MTIHDRKVLEAILRHCRKIMKTVERCKDYTHFLADDDAVDATITRLGQIGELSHRELSVAYKSAHPEIPWKAIYGMRNRLIHGYDVLNTVVIWDTIANDIPQIVKVLLHSICDDEGREVH